MAHSSAFLCIIHVIAKSKTHKLGKFAWFSSSGVHLRPYTPLVTPRTYWSEFVPQNRPPTVKLETANCQELTLTLTLTLTCSRLISEPRSRGDSAAEPDQSKSVRSSLSRHFKNVPTNASKTSYSTFYL